LTEGNVSTAMGSDDGDDARVVEAVQRILSVRTQVRSGQPPSGAVVNVSLPARWPAFLPPPMPLAQMQVSMPTAETAPQWSPRTPLGGSLPARPLVSWATIDPWSAWPELQLPPLPKISISRAAVQEPEVLSPPEVGQDGNSLPLQSLLWGLAGMLVAAVTAVTNRRSRMWFAVRARQSLAVMRYVLGMMP